MDLSDILSHDGGGAQVREAIALRTISNLSRNDPEILNPFDTWMTDEQFKSYKKKIQPKIAWESMEGQRLMYEAEERKDRGNTALHDKQYELAIEFYSKALQAAYQVQTNSKQIGVILSNRSHAFCEVHQFEAALEDAQHCVVVAPEFPKGAVRIMRAMYGLRRYQDGFGTGMGLVVFGTMKEEDRVHLFVEVLVYLPHTPDYTRLVDIDLRPEIWPRIIKKLVTKKAWKSISIIFQGRGNSPLILKNYKATDLDMSGLLESCSVADWKSWGQRLAVKLLQKGAKVEALDAWKKYGAHAAFRVGMRTGNYDLMRHLFQRHIPTGDRDRVDEDGNTLMHLACRESYPTKMAAFSLLLEHGLSPLCTNNNNLKPLDLLSPDDPDRNKINKVMDAKGYEVSTLRSYAKHTGVSVTAHDVSANIGPSTSGVAEVCESESQPYSPSNQPDRTVEHWTQAEVQKWLDDLKRNLKGFVQDAGY